MQLTGKKVAFLGDSITEGVGASDTAHRYTDVFSASTGASVWNYGISGTRIARQRAASANSLWDQNFLDRVEPMEPDMDIVVVFGGTNDFGHGDAPLGSFEDRDEYTFYGALHSLCTRLLRKYPMATVVFMTPLHRVTERNPNNEFGKPRSPLGAYVEAIREVCAYYSIPVLDLYTVAGMQPAIEEQRTRLMPDGLHPSDAGAKRISDRLTAFLTAL